MTLLEKAKLIAQVLNKSSKLGHVIVMVGQNRKTDICLDIEHIHSSFTEFLYLEKSDLKQLKTSNDCILAAHRVLEQFEQRKAGYLEFCKQRLEQCLEGHDDCNV
jgi:hypothetical protein